MSKTVQSLQQFTIVGGDGTIFKKGDIITIAGIYPPTQWEAFCRRFWPIRARWYRVSDYFSTLWSAICGRRDDY